MKWLSSPEFKVGVFVLTVAGIIGSMSLKVSQDVTYLTGARQHYFYLTSADGLIKNSPIKMAGIDVGTIRNVELEGGRARVTVSVRRDVALTKSAKIEIRPNGILGDKHIELLAGSISDPPLLEGEQISLVEDGSTLDKLVSEVSKIAQNIKAATEGDQAKPLGRIINNIEKITGDLAEFTGKHKGDVGAIVENLRDITDEINDLVNDESEEGLRSGWKSAMRGMKKLESAIKNVEEITAKINRGEGTIGKLVNDEQTVEKLNTAIDGVNNFLDAGNKTSTAIDFNSNYLGRDGAAKSKIALRIQPGLDRYYQLGIVSDSFGVTERTTTTTTSGTTSSTISEKKRFENKIKFEALLAKNFYDWTLKGGIIENSGGFGIDYDVFRKKLKVSLEAFDFDQLNLRMITKYNFFHGLYVSAGAEDILLKQGREVNSFIGAGLFLTNDDLKLLLTKLPF